MALGVLILVALARLASLGAGGQPSPGAPVASGSPRADLGPAPTPQALPPAVVADQLPAHPRDFPDPFVLPLDGEYLAFGTQNGRNVPVLRSTDLRTWRDAGEALAAVPSWSLPAHVWAPAVLRRPRGFVLYVTTRDGASGRQCITAATAASAAGPYRDDSTGPLVCQVDHGGSIDPHPVLDEHGDAHLLWKSEGLAGPDPPIVWSQRLRADGLALLGDPVELVRQDQEWEHPILEGPAMVASGGRWLLLYSANRWQTAEYAIGVAVCDSVRGPCRKPRDRPLLASTAAVSGPGGPTPFRDHGGALWLAYHGWSPDAVGYDAGGARQLWLDRLPRP